MILHSFCTGNLVIHKPHLSAFIIREDFVHNEAANPQVKCSQCYCECSMYVQIRQAACLACDNALFVELKGSSYEFLYADQP